MKKNEVLANSPINSPVTIEVRMQKKRYSNPVLFVPKVNGKPSVAPGKAWYVSFYWRTDPNGALDKKFTFNKGINRYKTVRERKMAGINLRDGYAEALHRGWNPCPNSKKITIQKPTTLGDSLKKAYEIKKKTKKGPTVEGYDFHLTRFLDWAKKNGYIGMEANRFEVDHFYEFMDWLRFDYVNEKTKEPLSGSSVNNHKASLSALFTQMKKERLVSTNVIKDVPKVDEEPINNKPFTIEEIKAIKKELEKNDPYLMYFITFLLYPILRPREVCRLRICDINTKNWMLTVETKTEALSHRRIIEKMKPTIEAMDLKGFPGKFQLFSNIDKPKDWSERKLKGRANYFGARFKKIKDKMGFGREYGLYSFRHTAILDLYNSMVSRGMGEQEILFKLMPITHHKSVAGIKNYLRQHAKSIPPDHSDIYTIDF